MNDENNIISPDDILLEDTREEISPYETEIKKEKQRLRRSIEGHSTFYSSHASFGKTFR